MRLGSQAYLYQRKSFGAYLLLVTVVLASLFYCCVVIDSIVVLALLGVMCRHKRLPAAN